MEALIVSLVGVSVALLIAIMYIIWNKPTQETHLIFSVDINNTNVSGRVYNIEITTEDAVGANVIASIGEVDYSTESFDLSDSSVCTIELIEAGLFTIKPIKKGICVLEYAADVITKGKKIPTSNLMIIFVKE